MSSKAAPLAEREHVVYRFYDAAGGLLYVGMTSDLPARLRAHAGDKPWWSQVAEIKSKAHPTRERAAAAELVAIISERPAHNRDGAVINLDDLIDAMKAHMRARRVDRAREAARWAFSVRTIEGAIYWASVLALATVMAGCVYSAAGGLTTDGVSAVVTCWVLYVVCAASPVCWPSVVGILAVLGLSSIYPYTFGGLASFGVYLVMVGFPAVMFPIVGHSRRADRARAEARALAVTA